ncbi:MAG: hypothetical protein ISQ22_07490 [Rhizobiales bacterium]|jgi:hypothetical protein|nr:hypothetical protein [Hyphomicrobiales bacterium]
MKRKGRKASKRTVRCTICTTHRWLGNNEGRWNKSTERRIQSAKEQMKEFAC